MSEVVRNLEDLEHISKLIKHVSFNRVHEKKAIHSLFRYHEHQVRNELYCTYVPTYVCMY